jgi:hypothetical protein
LGSGSNLPRDEVVLLGAPEERDKTPRPIVSFQIHTGFVTINVVLDNKVKKIGVILIGTVQVEIGTEFLALCPGWHVW